MIILKRVDGVFEKIGFLYTLEQYVYEGIWQN